MVTVTTSVFKKLWYKDYGSLLFYTTPSRDGTDLPVSRRLPSLIPLTIEFIDLKEKIKLNKLRKILTSRRIVQSKRSKIEKTIKLTFRRTF
jgi:hypothetical protein